MKIIKEYHIETWFSPKRCMIKYTKKHSFPYEDGDMKFIKYDENYREIHHRNNGPAEIFTDGSLNWYINNKEHRKDGPIDRPENIIMSVNRWVYKNNYLHEETYWNA